MAQGPIVDACRDQVRQGARSIVFVPRVASHIRMENPDCERISYLLPELESQVVGYSGLRIADPGSEPEYQLEAFMEFLYKLCKEEQIDYIVYGNVSRRNRPEQLLHATDVPSWLTAIETNRLFVVYQVNIVNE